MKSELTRAVRDLYKINAFYQDIEIILEDRLGEELLDGTHLGAPLDPEAKVRKIKELNTKIGALTGPWI